MTEDWRAGGFGLYVHWPFCQSKCPYCDFNSHVAAEIDQHRWADAYCAEIARLGEESVGRTLQSIFFGGGTPSLMNPDLVDKILSAVRRAWPMSNDPEITLEANPGSVEVGKFAAFRQAGVNRVSMGFQAMKDEDLRRLGRMHSVKEALRAFDVARSTFDRVSFDLIYARQDQSMADWRQELTDALRLAADHISLYQLTIEDGTVFAARHRAGKLRGLPDEDLSADLYELTQELCDAAGFPAYEVSNHAREGAESRHNLIYWRAGDYAGVGPGAHGRLSQSGGRVATEALRHPDAWLSQVTAKGHGELPRLTLSPADQAMEYLMMGLRLRSGIDLQRYTRLAGRPLDPARLEHLQSLGLISQSDHALQTTPRGRLVLNSIIRDLAPDSIAL
jgi:putative oxygen-independent coproporphyrinogen III oxidase